MSDPIDERPPASVSTGLAVFFYGLMLLAAIGLGVWWLDLDLVEWHDRRETALWFDAFLGALLGAVTVIASRILEHTTEWARVLNDEFKKILGNLNSFQVLVFAVTSGVAEEVFFRGFLQQALSDLVFHNDWIGLIVASLIFGMIHVGPDRKKFLPWTIMTAVLGFFMGLLYMYTGNILAPIVAHFTINFFNMLHIAGESEPPSEPSDEEEGEQEIPWNP